MNYGAINHFTLLTKDGVFHDAKAEIVTFNNVNTVRVTVSVEDNKSLFFYYDVNYKTQYDSWRIAKYIFDELVYLIKEDFLDKKGFRNIRKVLA